MIKLVDRYLGRASIQGAVLVWISLTLLFIFFSLLGELRSVQNDYTTSDVLWFVALSTPRMAYEIFPVSTLLGALVGIGGLAAANELVAFRTSGVSRLRLAAAGLAGTLMLTIPVMIMGEWVAPAAEQQARAFRLSEQVGLAIIGGPGGVWLRDGSDIVHIQRPVLTANRGEQSVAFNDVVIYSFTELVKVNRITRADRAIHIDDNWTLLGVNEVRFDDDGAVSEQADQRSWMTEVKPALLDSAVSRPKRLSMRSLVSHIEYLHENGLDDRVYQAALWRKMVFPFTVIAMVLAGMPFVFGSQRTQNLGVRLFIGMMLGGMFVIFSRMAQDFGDAYQIPAMVSHILPPLLLATTSILILRRTV
jgi:lipopolysaccharide export system permease protein